MPLKNRTKLDKFPQLSYICPVKSEHLDEFNVSSDFNLAMFNKKDYFCRNY